MRVFVLGGTGFIGSAVVRTLVARGHAVLALARSDVAMARLRESGAVPCAGDITRPASWIAGLPKVDAVVHAACDVSADMAAMDRDLLDALLPALAARANRPRFVYTGGCWLFGATGDRIATEATPFDPLPAFAWMVPQLQRILSDPGIQGIVLHPAMVYTASEGVFSRFARDAVESPAIRVVQSEEIRWPLVHREDLASLYAMALERAVAGSSYIGATIDGMTAGRIARAESAAANRSGRCRRIRTRRMGQGLCARSAAERTQGTARARLATAASGSRGRNRGASKPIVNRWRYALSPAACEA
jgi:nucleoside-diphosphate-sugar epimerase